MSLGWFDTPEYLAIALGVGVLYPLAAWRWGVVRVSEGYLLSKEAPADPNWWARLVHGLVATGVFSLLILGLVFRVAMYGWDGVP